MSFYSGQINQSGEPNGFGRAVSYYDSCIMINEGYFQDGHQDKGVSRRWGRLLVYHDSFTGPWKRELEAMDKINNFNY